MAQEAERVGTYIEFENNILPRIKDAGYNTIQIMAYFKIEQPGHAVKYIKEIDRANGTLEFSENREGCFQQDSGFFADSEFAYLKFHFTEAYPELEYMKVESSW